MRQMKRVLRERGGKDEGRRGMRRTLDEEKRRRGWVKVHDGTSHQPWLMDTWVCGVACRVEGGSARLQWRWSQVALYLRHRTVMKRSALQRAEVPPWRKTAFTCQPCLDFKIGCTWSAHPLPKKSDQTFRGPNRGQEFELHNYFISTVLNHGGPCQQMKS